MYIAWSANADRLQPHERKTSEEQVRKGNPPPGLTVLPDSRELIAADGRIMGYLRDGAPPAEQAELDRAEAAELAALRADRDRAELEELRELKRRRDAARAAEGSTSTPTT